MAEASQYSGLLLEAAARLGSKVSEAPAELISSRFNSEVLSEAIGRSTIARREEDLPKFVSAVRLDDIPVLIGEFSGNSLLANIEPQLRRYRNQATIARSWLASEATNLQMFLIGPPGALCQIEWRQLAAEIETDDRICRKLVWLFDEAPNEASADAFLSRTFVARPWPKEDQRISLDTVASYSLPEGWEAAVDDENLDFDGLVEVLIKLEAKI